MFRRVRKMTNHHVFFKFVITYCKLTMIILSTRLIDLSQYFYNLGIDGFRTSTNILILPKPAAPNTLDWNHLTSDDTSAYLINDFIHMLFKEFKRAFFSFLLLTSLSLSGSAQIYSQNQHFQVSWTISTSSSTAAYSLPCPIYDALFTRILHDFPYLLNISAHSQKTYLEWQ